MKILFVNNIFPPGYVGGYELGAFEVARGMAARGHQVSVLTSDYFQDDAGELADLNVDRSLECSFVSHRTYPESIMDLKGFYIDDGNIRKLGGVLRRFQPDVVLLFNIMGLGALGMVQFLQACGVPTILYIMDHVFLGVRRDTRAYEKYIAAFGQACLGPLKIVAMSRNVMREISASLGVAFTNVLYVPGWIHVTGESTEPVCCDDGGGVRFVASSRVAPHKGTDIILHAAEALVSRGALRFSIDIYGAGQVGPFLQLVQARGLGQYVRFLGNRPKDEMLLLFGQYEVLLFPTWEREPFGFTVGEAAAAGCVSIMTAGIGASEWFMSDIDCMKIARTADALASAMYRWMSMAPDERLRMRRAAMKSARRHLPFARWLEVIEQACTEKMNTGDPDRWAHSRGVQSAFLFLNQLWQESLA